MNLLHATNIVLLDETLSCTIDNNPVIRAPVCKILTALIIALTILIAAAQVCSRCLNLNF